MEYRAILNVMINTITTAVPLYQSAYTRCELMVIKRNVSDTFTDLVTQCVHVNAQTSHRLV